MIPGIRGRLLSASFVRDLLPGLAPDPPPAAFARALESWWERAEDALGPASSVRAIAETAAVPLLEILDLAVTSREDVEGGCLLETSWSGRQGPRVLVVPWNQPLSPSWRAAVLRAIAIDGRWSFCTNGTALRLVDSRRTWSRDYLEFDLTLVGREPEPMTLLWTFVRGPAITSVGALLDRAIEQSDRHGVDVCRALGDGVLEALTALLGSISGTRRSRGRTHAQVDPRASFDLSITVLYRVLFLLFAEARGLVPMWHAVYRDRYSVDAIVAAVAEGRPCRGMWQAIQAISRLACTGCRAGELTVNAFNGKLFSPSDTEALERLRVDDAAMARAIAAVGSRPMRRRRDAGGAHQSDTEVCPRRRILYRDLDVEQLGAVYEQLLEYEPRTDRPETLERTRDIRKASAAFYTPRQVTAFIVRQTLGPLVAGRSSAEILALRVLDPAMGSGAFLVAACRFLASAAEDALIREGRWHPGDVTTADRVSLRREIALRCLFGVDLNPMAVQLARLSLWLVTLAADKPLSFLDHHLVSGDSLIGATPEDTRRQPSKMPGRRLRSEALPLFADEALAPALDTAARVRAGMSLQPDDSVRIVRSKEQALAELHTPAGIVARWSRVLDLWCAGWFWHPGPPPDRTAFADLRAGILHDRTTLPAATAARMLARSEAIARERRFLHWPLVFPEVFTTEEGGRGTDPGFDAIVGNPPWDMVRGDSGADDVRRSRRLLAGQLTDFVREAGVYRVASRSHINRYQLFVERALQLVRHGGRVGLVLPSGIASDAGAAALRRHLFERAEVDSITGLDNRAGIFPIHRSVRFALVTCTRGRPTNAVACRFGLSSPAELDDGRHPPLLLSRRFIERVSGEDDLGVPEMAAEMDLRIVERVSANLPRLGNEDGWNARFGRELNASDDRASFQRARGAGARPVVEGKQIDSFRVALDSCRFELRPEAAAAKSAGFARVAYRDVASATNRLTLIAAIVPAHAVTTHTAFCLKSRLGMGEQRVLCALLNSFVANYLVRLRVNTHVTVSLVSRLPLPVLRPGDRWFERLSRLSDELATSSLAIESLPAYAELQAIAAHLFGLTSEEFAHVLSTFPLVESQARGRSLVRFGELRSG
jgi:hypothetical protein